MERADIVETNLQFIKDLAEREATDMIVIHHTGENDIDASAEQIHEWHLNNPGWAGIGYHYVIRKNGTIERGRPEWAIGSHAYGENSHTIGIHLSGDFMTAYPTEIQIERVALLIANICEDYDIPTDREHIVGHGELMATDCPGTHLQALLDDGTLTGKANYYRYGPPKEGGAAGRKAAADSDGGDIEERIWKFLKGKGLSDFAAAGVMGNLYAESGLSPINLENYYEAALGMSDAEYTEAVDNGSYGNFVHDKAGYGIAQWTYYTRKQNLLNAARTAGKSIGDLGLQLEYLWDEMQGYGSMMEKLKGAASVLEASNAVLLDFERPADQSAAVQQKRAGFGQGFYDKFAGDCPAESTQEASEVRYNRLSDMPEWARPTIEKMIQKKLLGGNGETDAEGNPAGLDLSMDMLRIFVVNDRAGVYGG